MAVQIPAAERRRVAQLARQLISDEPALGATDHFGANVTTGLGAWPSLFIEDHSAIRLFEQVGDPTYSYRALLLAGEGDLVAVGVPRNRAFEAYCRDHLNLGWPIVLRPMPRGTPTPLARRCFEDRGLLRRIAKAAQLGGGLNLVPYMGSGGIWVLASRIAEASGSAVRVAAPPPRLTHRVNDKLWFAARVGELLGAQSLPPAHPVFGLASLAGRVAALARSAATVAIKVPDSASSAGNIVLSAREVKGVSSERLRERLLSLLQRAGWRNGFPLMVTAWESPIVASPSVQLWIPKLNEHHVVIEGIFDQTITGTARVFAGAAPTNLSQTLQRRVAYESAMLGGLLQNLGYFGRCSFDAILVGRREASAQLHWIECNGRWGGTSIPMTLANRLVGDWRQRPFVIIERDDLRGPGRGAGAFLESIEDELFIPGQRESGAVLLSPGQVERGTGFEIMVLGDTVEVAQRHARRLFAKLSPPARD